jgi:hypothetical protein
VLDGTARLHSIVLSSDEKLPLVNRGSVAGRSGDSLVERFGGRVLLEGDLGTED